jgi:5-methylcytosine-specific restriction endonuclease McrA
MLQRDMATNPDVVHMSDASLLAEVARAAADERNATVRLIALLGEVDARKLYLAEGCSSMFTYCTQVLHLSEHAAYGRIETARAARSYPVILDRLADGTLTLTAVGLLRQHLTLENYMEVLDAARHKSKREVEGLIARVAPQPAAAATVRKLPSGRSEPPASPSLLEASQEPGVPSFSDAPVISHSRHDAPNRAVTPLAPERYKIQFTVAAATHAKLRQVQDLLRHSVPDGNPAEIFDKALTMLLAHLQRTKIAAAERPRAQAPPSKSRHIPATVKRKVWSRDGGRCAFVGAHGRCTETGFLEFHHVEPYAEGGTAAAQNIQLRCRAHNLYEADLFFGTAEPEMVRERRAAYLPYATRSGPSCPSACRQSEVTRAATP